MKACRRWSLHCAGLLAAASLAGPAACAAAQGQEAADRFLGGYLVQSRVLYPLRAGAWTAVGEHRFEEAALGVSVRYRNERDPGLHLDLYVYPGGALLEPAFATAATRTVDEIETFARGRDPRNFQAGTQRTFDLPGGDAALLGEYAPRPRSYALQLGEDGRPWQSAMAMALRDMYFFKVRLSAQGDAGRRELLRAQAEGFLRDVLARVRVANTGACHRSAMAAMAMPADGRRPDAILASRDDGTARELWIDETHVYMDAKALSDPALRAERLASGQALRDALRDALRGRCIAPEEMDMAVPQDMRELRIEYGGGAGPPGRGTTDAAV